MSSDSLNHRSTNQPYQTSTQRSQNSYSQPDNDRSKTDGRPSNNGYGNSSPYNNKNNDGLNPEGTPFESETDNGFRDNAPNYQLTSTAKWTTQYSSTQGYNIETTTRRTQNRPTASSATTANRRKESDINRAPQRPEFILDPNPILSPVDRVPVMIEYPKIDYDKVECEYATWFRFEFKDRV